MTLTEWQQRFDAWVAQHYTQADAAHDVPIFAGSGVPHSPLWRARRWMGW